MTRLLKRWLRAASLLILAAALGACATGPKLVVHSFNCAQWKDGWAEKADLLAYSYANKVPMLTETQPWPGHSSIGCGGITANMPVADFLYVKWRLKDSGEVLEDRVDLRSRLPTDMTNQTVTFVIDGRQLYVFLVTPTEINQRLLSRSKKTWHSKYNVTYEIYPHNELKQ
ncbi:MAG: hypothetical protein EKK53_21030 [Burkholderiales bacterium]|nr:MAG: hypothetical protein EKK53_21030 [Burkholderiales bacterium]